MVTRNEALIEFLQITFASAMAGVVATKLKVSVGDTDCLLNLDGDVCTYVDVCISSKFTLVCY